MAALGGLRHVKWLAILYAGIIGGIVIAADTGHLGILGQIYGFPGGDKVGHFIVFGFLSLLVNLSILRPRMGAGNGLAVVISSALLAVVITLEEVSQIWISSRTFSVLDLTASCAGVASFAWLAWKITGRKALQSSPQKEIRGRRV